MLALGVLCSGSGTNLQAILDACASGALAAEVRVVICNRPGAGALERAARAGVPARLLSHRDFATREAYDARLVEELTGAGVSAVVLAGFMRLVTPVLLGAFPDRVINIHPAILPSFPGVDGQQQALDHGVTLAGCTVHLVDAGTDTGPVLAQAAVPVLDGDDRGRLAAREVQVERAEGRRPRVRVPGRRRAFFSDEP